MTSHPPPTSPPILHTIQCSQPVTYSPPSLAMNFALGMKAKLAITNSLGKLNKKLRMSSFSSGAFSGVIQNQSAWNVSEQRIWVVILMMGVALLYGTRISVPFALSDLASAGEWSVNVKSLVLGSFYWGYVCAPFLGYRLADLYGGETVQWVGAIFWSLGMLLTVQVAPYSHHLVVLSRFFCGVLQGFHIPALLNVLSRRSLENSRAFIFSMILSAGHLGSASVGVLNSLPTFSSTPSSSHTSYLFLLFSFLGVVWAGLVRFFFLRSLKHHKTHYKLSDTLNGSGSGILVGGASSKMGGAGGSREKLKLDVQLKGISSRSGFSWNQAKKMPIIVLFIAYFSSSLFLHVAMSWLPSYWLSICTTTRQKHVWLCNFLPWVAMVIGSGAASWLSQWLISKSVSVTLIRCTFTSLSLGGSTFFLLIVVIVTLTGHTHFPVMLVCFILVCVFHGLSMGGSSLNPLDLAPSHMGLLYSGVETAGAIAGIVGVHLTGLSIFLLGSPVLVFILIALLNLIALTMFLAFGSGQKLQLDTN